MSKVVIPAPTATPKPAAVPNRPASPRLAEFRENRRNSPLIAVTTSRKDESGFVWMTVPKNYRYVFGFRFFSLSFSSPPSFRDLVLLFVRFCVYSHYGDLARSFAPVLRDPCACVHSSFASAAITISLVLSL